MISRTVLKQRSGSTMKKPSARGQTPDGLRRDQALDLGHDLAHGAQAAKR
jgi:hypothetical protein